MEKKSKLKTLLLLFWTFFKLGAMTFGGGYVMLVLIREEFVDKKKWIDGEELLKVYAIAESTPGPVAINSSTYIGCKLAGTIGAIVSTIAIILPSLIISYIIAMYLSLFMKYEIVQNAFFGIKCGVSVLILVAGIDAMKKVKKNAYNIVVITFCFVAMLLIDLLSINISSVYLIIVFGIINLCIFAIKNKGKEKEENKGEDK